MDIYFERHAGLDKYQPLLYRMEASYRSTLVQSSCTVKPAEGVEGKNWSLPYFYYFLYLFYCLLLTCNKRGLFHLSEPTYIYYVFSGVKAGDDGELPINHSGHSHSQAAVGQLVRIVRDVIV